MLRIEHYTKKYGDKVAVNDLSLHIQPGELYGFIGHNGAGKTTTIKACCGILDFDEGEIYINGTSIKDDPIACKRQIGDRDRLVFFRILCRGFAIYMRMSKYELVRNPVTYIGDVEFSGFASHLGVEDDVQQYISQFFANLRHVVATDGGGQFVGLFYGVLPQTVEGLFPIPWALLAKRIHDIEQSTECR